MKLQEINDVMMVWELRGEYPNIPLAAGVDYESLIAGDDNPMFLTLPIGKVNSKSGNNRFYDEALINELERQVSDLRPVGLMGHMREEDRATQFPPEAVHWVGVQRVGELLWGKGYIPPGEARERIKRYKATGRKIATSIDALARGVWDEALKAYKMLTDGFQLNQIDIAPADRAGIPALAAVPHITKEMDGDNPTKDEEMDKFQIIRELTVEDAKLLPEQVQDAIKATVPQPKEVEIVSKLSEALGVEGEGLVSAISEMVQEQETQRKAAVTTRVTELVNEGVKVEAMRGLVLELVNARNPQSADEAERAYKAVIEMDSVKAALANYVVNTMGPAQRTPMQRQNGGGKYFNIPEEAK